MIDSFVHNQIEDIKASRVYRELVDGLSEFRNARVRLRIDSESNQGARHKSALWIIICLSLLIRIIYILTTRNIDVFHFLILDASSYWKWAGDIVDKGIFTDPVTFASPLYAYFLAALRFFVEDNPYVISLLQLTAGAFYPILIYNFIYEILATFKGADSGVVRTALIGAVLAVLWSSLLFYDGMILKTSLTIWLTTLGLWLLYKAQNQKLKVKSTHSANSGQASQHIKFEKRETLLYFCAGIVWGLVALARENAILFVGLLAFASGLGFVFDRFSRIPRLPGILRDFRLPLIFFIAFLLPIAPITLKNYVVGHDFVFIGTSGGMNFYQGNFIGSDGVLMPPPFVRPDPEFEQRDAHAEAERRTDRLLKPSEGSSFWFGQGLKEISQAPSLFLKNTILKALYIVNSSEISDNYQIGYYRQFATPLRVLLPDGTIVVAALTGLLLTVVFGQFRRYSIVNLYAVIYAGSLVLSHYNARYRLEGLAPVFLLYASIAVMYIWKILRERYFIILETIGVGVALLWVFTAVSYPAVGLNTTSIMESHLGTYYLEQVKDYVLAVDHFQLSITADPTYQWSETNLARAYAKLGDTAQTIVHLKNSIRLRPDIAYTYDMLGYITQHKDLLKDAFLSKLDELEVIDETKEKGTQMPTEGFLLLQQKQVRKALVQLSVDITRYPDNPLILTALGTAYKQDRQYYKAEIYLSRARMLNPNLLPASYNLGTMYLATGEMQKAVEVLTSITRIFPEFEQTQLALADAYRATGNREMARKYYLRYIADSKNLPGKETYIAVAKAKILELD